MLLKQYRAFIKLGGGTVEKVNLPFFYQLGAQLNPLTKMTVNTQTRSQILLACIPARSIMSGLLTWSGQLSVCLNSAQEFINAMDDVGNWWFTVKPEDHEKADLAIDSKFIRVIQTAIKFETVLNEELATLSTYSVSKIGAYLTADLISNAEKVFPPSVRDKLSADIIREIQEAGKCLVFDIPTACGFHMLRATEAVLREYCLALGESEKKGKSKNWGDYIAYLYKLAESTVIDKEKVNHIKMVLALLQQVKDQDRNLIMHPEVILSADDSFKLFDTTKTAIMTMSEKLPLHQPPNIPIIEPPPIIKAVEPPKLIKIEAVKPPESTKIEAIEPDKSNNVDTNRADEIDKNT